MFVAWRIEEALMWRDNRRHDLANRLRRVKSLLADLISEDRFGPEVREYFIRLDRLADGKCAIKNPYVPEGDEVKGDEDYKPPRSNK